MFILGELKKKRTILSFLLGFLLLGVFLYYIDLKEVLAKTREARLAPLLVAFFLHYFAYYVRGYRWKKIFHKWDLKASSWVLAKIMLIFQFVDCILPAKIGDLYGAQLMKANYGLSRSISLGSIVLWRFLDALMTVVLCGTATLFLFGNTVPSVMMSLFQWWTVLIIGAVALGALFLYKSHWFSRHLPESVQVLLDAFSEGVKPDIRTMPALLISTAVIWLLEAGRFYYACQSMDLSIGFWAAIIITTSAAMATAVPFTPSGLGAVEIFMVSVMTLLDFPGGPVLYTVILLDRIVSYWSQIPAGILTMWISGYTGMKLWTQPQEITPEALPRS